MYTDDENGADLEEEAHVEDATEGEHDTAEDAGFFVKTELVEFGYGEDP